MSSTYIAHRTCTEKSRVKGLAVCLQNLISTLYMVPSRKPIDIIIHSLWQPIELSPWKIYTHTLMHTYAQAIYQYLNKNHYIWCPGPNQQMSSQQITTDHWTSTNGDGLRWLEWFGKGIVLEVWVHIQTDIATALYVWFIFCFFVKIAKIKLFGCLREYVHTIGHTERHQLHAHYLSK